jgi:hypothetical protein
MTREGAARRARMFSGSASRWRTAALVAAAVLLLAGCGATSQ